VGVPKHSGGTTLRGEHELPGNVGTLSTSLTGYMTARVALDANTVFPL